MKIIEPDVKLIEQSKDIITHVTRCARVCYKRESGNDDALYNSLLKKHHWSMFRHHTYYFIIPKGDEPEWVANLFKCVKVYGLIVIGIDINVDDNYFYIVTNANWTLDNHKLNTTINSHIVTAKEFANFSITSWNMMRYTFKITTQISTSRELNRVSPNNIAEQSTRYVYEDGTICRPHWMTEEQADVWNKAELVSSEYILQCDNSFKTYKNLIENGMPRQDARGVLPIDTATNVIYTYSVREWRHIIDLRADEKHAHPNAVIIATAIRCELERLGYEF